MQPAGCLDENAVVAFLAARMAAPERAQAESHLQSCNTCTELVTWVAADLAHRSRAPGQEGRPFIGALAAGSRVDRYQILNAVGQGGMGQVYAAYHPDLDRRVALKVVHELGADSADRRTRLLREARAIARLSHPNVITVHDAGTFDDRVYIAMEFIEGQTVDAWLRSAPRGWREILDVFIAAARGLAAAHTAGIIHRDFKPQNVMIAHDGMVRVMDFGLARLLTELAAPAEDEPATRFSRHATTVTKTGALVGTLAYMAPEQFRGEAIDARADQFSFCVALYEALYGVRPALAHLESAPQHGVADMPRTANVPAWLKSLLSRGLAVGRERRFGSMNELIRVLVKGRTAQRRRAVAGGAVFGVLLLALGGWRASRGDKISCALPAERLGAAWSGHEDARREMIHHAFTASGLPTAEASWRRIAGLLDGYVAKWAAMYMDTCEATHVRGEQSSELLDLKMNCLGENLAEVRALTNVLAQADAALVPRAAAAMNTLTPIGRCADLAVLRSTVPLPRDPAVLGKVRELEAQLKDMRALVDLGKRRRAAAMADALGPEVRAVGYKPLLAELLELVAIGKVEVDPSEAEKVMEEAFLTAEASGDDVTAVKAASFLIYVVGYVLTRREDSERWARIAYALLEKFGPTQPRLRSWVMTNHAAVAVSSGDYGSARRLLDEAVRLKVQALGEQHWDVAVTLSNLAYVDVLDGEPQRAVAEADRALEIFDTAGDPDDWLLPDILTNRGTALTALGRYREAEQDFSTAFRIRPRGKGPVGMQIGDQLHGYGTLRVAQERAAEAIPMLQDALAVRERTNPDATFTADTRFSLAQALWAAGSDRRRALSLAAASHASYAKHGRFSDEAAVATWLAERGRQSPRGSSALVDAGTHQARHRNTPRAKSSR